ncbi:hypothetical protein ONE63_004784 [Megalurothrips usitatus]|uniref:Uncharacterized protein n=1 Tax=Megalurothrips usitatus TaxID=439358 RepID=A0AAV7X438_9NEOP|nr:hypothetical protein ONE63_004784 [Megalurothrips usitatus]
MKRRAQLEDALRGAVGNGTFLAVHGSPPPPPHGHPQQPQPPQQPPPQHHRQSPHKHPQTSPLPDRERQSPAILGETEYCLPLLLAYGSQPTHRAASF